MLVDASCDMVYVQLLLALAFVFDPVFTLFPPTGEESVCLDSEDIKSVSVENGVELWLMSDRDVLMLWAVVAERKFICLHHESVVGSFDGFTEVAIVLHAD